MASHTQVMTPYTPRTPLIKKKPMLNLNEEHHIRKTREDLLKELENVQIHCKKYHYTYEPGYQSNDYNDCILQLEDDGEVLQMYKIHKSESKLGKLGAVMSNASVKIEQLEGFIFGPNSSRFWTMRKHINCIEQCHEYEYPFFAWQCITLQTKYRDIDLVIANRNHMMQLVHYLVLVLKTVDGMRNSAMPYLNIQVIQQLLEEKATREKSGKVRNVGATYVDDEDIRMLKDLMERRPLRLEHMYQTQMQRLSLPVCKRFNLLVWRMKISYHAFRDGLTVAELFMVKILKTYSERKKKGLIADPWPSIDPKLIKIILMIQNPEQDDDEDVIWEKTIGKGKSRVLTPNASQFDVTKHNSPKHRRENSFASMSAEKRKELAQLYERYI